MPYRKCIMPLVILSMAAFWLNKTTAMHYQSIIDTTQTKNYYNLTVDQYEKIIAKDSIVLVGFSATWCGPCKIMAKQIELLQQEMPNKFALIIIDIDKNPLLKQRFNIDEIPFFKLYIKGKLKNNLVGMMSKEALKQSIFNN